MKIQRTIIKHLIKNNYMWYIATLWLIEAANNTVSLLVIAYVTTATTWLRWKT
jgi:hypothetical protein